MKKLAALLVGAGLMVTAGSAWAVPATWTDVMDFDKAFSGVSAFSYTHNLVDNGFTPFYDSITSYTLALDLDSTSRYKAVVVALPGEIGLYNFAIDTNTFGESILGTWQLNTLGSYTVSFLGAGPFTLDSSTLTATGYDNTPETAPVPEPGTLVMLGAGLLGLTIYGRRRMQK